MVDDVRAVQLWLDDLVIKVLIVVDCGNLLLFECTHLFEVDLAGLELLLSTIIVILSVFHLKLRYILLIIKILYRSNIALYLNEMT